MSAENDARSKMQGAVPLSPWGEGNYEDFILDVVVMHKLFVEVCIYFNTREVCGRVKDDIFQTWALRMRYLTLCIGESKKVVWF